MAANVQEIGRRVRDFLIPFTIGFALLVDAVASFIGSRIGEMVVYTAGAFVLFVLAGATENVKRFLDE